MTEEEESDILYFFLYFFGTCVALCFTVFLMFLCFSGRICIFIYYRVIHTGGQNNVVTENTPLIVETEYFPRPGYDGYCLQGDEEPKDMKVVASCNINIGERELHLVPASSGSGNYPRGILTPDRVRREKRKSRSRINSVKSVSFNPKTEFQIV